LNGQSIRPTNKLKKELGTSCDDYFLLQGFKKKKKTTRKREAEEIKSYLTEVDNNRLYMNREEKRDNNSKDDSTRALQVRV